MLGGNNIAVAGPCFNSSVDELVCKFGSIWTRGVIINKFKGVCTVPSMLVTGTIQVHVSTDSGKSFKFTGTYCLCKSNLMLDLFR